MKSNILFSLLLWVLISCQNEEKIVPKMGEIQFRISPKSNSNGRISETTIPVAVILSVKDDKGNVIEKNKKLPLYTFGQSYVSENLQLNIGHYQLTEFLILDGDNKIIYSSPLEGSKQAQYVKDALPIDFVITENGSTEVIPEVLVVSSAATPESFGYVSFGFEVVAPRLVSLCMTSPNLTFGMKYNYYYKENRLSTIELYDADTSHWDVPLYGKTVIEYQYNPDGKLVKESWNTNSGWPTQPETVIQYEYNGDKLSRSTATTYSLNSVREVNYFYDNVGTLKTVLIGWPGNMAYQVNIEFDKNLMSHTTYHRKSDGTLGAFYQQVKVGYDNHPIPYVNGWMGDLNEWFSTFRPTVWLNHNITMFEYYDETQNGFCSGGYKYQYNEFGYPVRREFVEGNCGSNSYIEMFLGYPIARYTYE